MAVATENKRQQVTLPLACWDSLLAEARGQGSTVSQVLLAHVEASQSRSLVEAQQTLEVLGQVLTRLDGLLTRMEAMQQALDTLAARLPSPLPVAPPGPSPGPLPPPLPVRRGFFRRGGR